MKLAPWKKVGSTQFSVWLAAVIRLDQALNKMKFGPINFWVCIRRLQANVVKTFASYSRKFGPQQHIWREQGHFWYMPILIKVFSCLFS